ncbi:MAG: hypothetical protein Q8872_01245 [Candidatus Phytoplasma australasiaticum]|nr:hypothetical protein [Candidatus Phytoplasma australasiaticum]
MNNLKKIIKPMILIIINCVTIYFVLKIHQHLTEIGKGCDRICQKLDAGSEKNKQELVKTEEDLNKLVKLNKILHESEDKFDDNLAELTNPSNATETKSPEPKPE